MVQQLSDAELEIMKTVWGNSEDVTLFPYILDGLVARGKPCQKNTLIVLLSRLMNKGFLSAKKIGRRMDCTIWEHRGQKKESTILFGRYISRVTVLDNSLDK